MCEVEVAILRAGDGNSKERNVLSRTGEWKDWHCPGKCPAMLTPGPDPVYEAQRGLKCLNLNKMATTCPLLLILDQTLTCALLIPNPHVQLVTEIICAPKGKTGLGDLEGRKEGRKEGREGGRKGGREGGRKKKGIHLAFAFS